MDGRSAAKGMLRGHESAAPTASAVEEGDARLVSLLKNWEPTSMAVESDLNIKMLHLDPTEAPRQQEALTLLRWQLDAVGRQAKAEQYKGLANVQFGKQAWRIALVGYLAGVWMLRQDCDAPPCPPLLANHLCSLECVISALGPVNVPMRGESSALYHALLVNLAAAALKLNASTTNSFLAPFAPPKRP